MAGTQRSKTTAAPGRGAKEPAKVREHPRKRRAHVIETAALMFHEKGYEATTIQDIADAVGLLKGSLYYYFASKEDLLFEVLQEVHQAALEAVFEAIEPEHDPLQVIRAFVETLAQFNADNKVKMGILLHDFRALSEERQSVIVHERDRYDSILRQSISDGQQQAVICPDVDPKLATFAIMGMINMVSQWYVPTGGVSSPYIGSFFASLVVRALACTPETHTSDHIAALGGLRTGL